MRYRSSLVLASACALTAAPAIAEVTAASNAGFVSRNEVEVTVPPQEAWALLLKPAWWSPAHSYSGSADNMSIEPVAGGCFCETVPRGKMEPRLAASSTCAWSMSRPVRPCA